MEHLTLLTYISTTTIITMYCSRFFCEVYWGEGYPFSSLSLLTRLGQWRQESYRFPCHSRTQIKNKWKLCWLELRIRWRWNQINSFSPWIGKRYRSSREMPVNESERKDPELAYCRDCNFFADKWRSFVSIYTSTESWKRLFVMSG